MKHSTACVAVVMVILGVSGGARCGEPCPEPMLRPGLPGDATDDAAGRGQMFENMEELGSPCHRYLEVNDAGHGSAGTVLPNLRKIFEFFEECGRRQPS